MKIISFMKKNLEKTLVEMFGDPLEPKMGTRVGELPGITSVGAVGARDMREDELGGICPDCGMMPIDGKCGCAADESGVCPTCGMMSIHLDKPCSCGLNESVDEATSCKECGMNEDVCECGYMNEKKKPGPSKKTAQKILRGTKTFKQKMKKVAGWAEDPAAAAAWMMHKATGKWPREK